MKVMKITKMWWEGLTKTDATIKKLTKSKLTFKDGAYSLIAFSFVISLLFLIGIILLAGVTGGNSTTMITEGLNLSLITFILFSLISVIGLAVFTWLFRKIADKHKGKGKFGKEAGLFGIIAGMMFLTMIPYFIGFFLMLILNSTPIISYLIYGIGIALTVAYTAKVSGIMIEAIVEMEKLKINKILWIQGLTIGVLYLIFFLLLGLISQMIGVMIPLA